MTEYFTHGRRRARRGIRSMTAPCRCLLRGQQGGYGRPCREGPSAPSPLSGVYQAQWRFSAITLTPPFAVYALLLPITFLVFRAVSAFPGRPRLIPAGPARAARG